MVGRTSNLWKRLAWSKKGNVGAEGLPSKPSLFQKREGCELKNIWRKTIKRINKEMWYTRKRVKNLRAQQTRNKITVCHSVWTGDPQGVKRMRRGGYDEINHKKGQRAGEIAIRKPTAWGW